MDWGDEEDGWMDGWIDEWIDEWMDGWMKDWGDGDGSSIAPLKHKLRT